MRKLFNLTTVASGAAIGMIVAGALAVVAGIYDRQVVHDQLTPQKIVFPEKGPELPPELNKYAGEQVDTGAEAKAYADDFIGAHLEGIGEGKSYSEVSAEFMEDPNNKELAAQRQTMFMGETLRDAAERLGLGNARHGRDDHRHRADRDWARAPGNTAARRPGGTTSRRRPDGRRDGGADACLSSSLSAGTWFALGGVDDQHVAAGVTDDSAADRSENVAADSRPR